MANYYLSGNYNNTIDVILSLTESTDTTANTSTFNYTLYIYKKNNTSYSYSRGNHYGVTIGGYTTGDLTAGYSLSGVPLGGTYTLHTGTTTAIAHNSDGSGTVTISAWVRQDQLSNYNFSLNQTINLTSIPRASKPTASNATIGNTITIRTNRASTAFTHTIQYKIGSLGYTNIRTGVQDSVDWTLPASLANYISNATSGTVTINCITYNGSTQIGTATTTLTATIPGTSLGLTTTGTITMGQNNNVTVSNYCSAYLSVAITWSFGNGSGTLSTSWGTTTHNWPQSTYASKIPTSTSGKVTITQTTKRGNAVVSSTSTSFTLNLGSTSTSASLSISDANNYASRFGSYLSGKSKLSWSVSASPSIGSSISSYTVSVGGIGTYYTDSGSVNVPASLSSGTRSVSVTTKDGRGGTATASQNYTVTKYSTPTVTGTTVSRTDSSGNPQPSSGTYIRIKGTVSWTAVGSNAVSAKYRIRQQNGAWPSTFTNLTLSSNNFDVTVGTYSYEVGWEVQIVTADSVDTTGTTASFTVGSAVFPIDVYPSQTSGIAFGKVSTREGAVSIADAWVLEAGKRAGLRTSSGTGTAGYMHLFSINCNGQVYNDQIMQFKVFAREGCTDAYLYFANANNTTLSVSDFVCNKYGEYAPDLYAHCNGSVCDIYARAAGWTDITFHIEGNYKTSWIVTPIKSYVASLPSESATANTHFTFVGQETRFSEYGLPSFSGNPPFLIGIESFANGGTIKWKETSAITVGAASTATTATTATKLDTPNNNGYTTDDWGNFNHSSTDTTNYWHINKNNGSAAFSVYFESGVVNAIGDYRLNSTSIVPTGSNAQNSGYIRFPNARVQIAWDRRQINSQYVNNAWDKLYESAQLSFSNWAASFSGIPTTAYYITNTTSNFGCMIECYAAPTTTNPGKIYAVRPNASGSQNLVITALGVGPY